jgi:hypothetical protein
MFVPGKLFEPNLMLVGNANKVPTLEWSIIQVHHAGKALALIANIRLVWEILTGSNTLAYYEN